MTEADRAALRARLATRLRPRWRTRFAPAPTGQLHLGHAVNAVYVWSVAKAFGGSVLLRIEDHDAQRSRAVFADGFLEDLDWLGLESDNAAHGITNPVRQSDRAQDHASALAALSRTRVVYACRCSRREIAAHGASDSELRYPGTCRDAGVPLSETPARRLVLADVAVEFDDLRHGPQRQVPARQCGDLLLRDRLAQWTYQFAVVVDDMAHGVDVIIRGDDLLPSTGRQVLLRQALDGTAFPLVLHHPLVRHPDGTKLSKSKGDTALASLRAAGWTAQRVLGQAAWLGGLQATPAPLEVADLPALWAAGH